MNEKVFNKIDKCVLIFLFLICIYLPLLFGIIDEDKIVADIEKRNLAKLPLSPNSLKSFNEYPERFNVYYSDHFGFRESLTKYYFNLINQFGDRSSIDDVTVGQNGWLFLGSIKPGYQEHDDPIGDAINVNLFIDNELKDFARSILTIKNWLNERGIAYIYVIAPIKHTIYFENLPKYISKQNAKSSTDQLVEYLRKHTDVTVVDLRQSLLDEKKKHQVYFKTDSHWNHYGANAAQFEIMQSIKRFFPEQIDPYILGNSQFKLLSKGTGDLAKLKKLESITEEFYEPIFSAGCTPVNQTPNVKIGETYTIVCDTQKLNAVIFRDSFFTALQPYFSRQFHRSTYIWQLINYTSLIKYVEQESPDIVIDEIVERSLPYIPSSDHFKSIR